MRWSSLLRGMGIDLRQDAKRADVGKADIRPNRLAERRTGETAIDPAHSQDGLSAGLMRWTGGGEPRFHRL
jgi:hypothetical protein